MKHSNPLWGISNVDAANVVSQMGVSELAAVVSAADRIIKDFTQIRRRMSQQQQQQKENADAAVPSYQLLNKNSVFLSEVNRKLQIPLELIQKESKKCLFFK